MPKLGSTDTTRLELPSTKDSEDKAWIEVRTTLLLGDVAEMTKHDGITDQTIALISKVVSAWNYTEDGTPGTAVLPITTENINKLNIQDFKFIAAWVTDNLETTQAGVSDDEKKTLSDTSTVTSTQDPPVITPLTDY